ncbi:hypothetical protein [Bacteroides sp. 51]|uniref:hypothetical protein n=1 Tax=Bacteroides sp. 51 TaxID=2302938 RepID=UPI0013D359C4|nr:hypothetical protein [Bacteroides sp. 51]NDV83671.1 hypothetical protein [Bacteroides sp. 51]
MKKKKKQQLLTDYIKAARKGSREAEIELYGHPLNHHKIVKSKKVYDRKKNKADDKDLPYFFAGGDVSLRGFSISIGTRNCQS